MRTKLSNAYTATPTPPSKPGPARPKTRPSAISSTSSISRSIVAATKRDAAPASVRFTSTPSGVAIVSRSSYSTP